MSHLDDVIENAHHFRDAPKDCVVEFAPDQYVVTATVEQAEALRHHLAEVHTVEPVEPVEPVKRGPGRPRKVVTD